MLNAWHVVMTILCENGLQSFLESTGSLVARVRPKNCSISIIVDAPNDHERWEIMIGQMIQADSINTRRNYCFDDAFIHSSGAVEKDRRGRSAGL